MCVCSGGGAAGRRHWGQRTSAGGHNTPAHTHTHTYKHTLTHKQAHVHTLTRHMNTHCYTRRRHLATRTPENTEICTCKQTRRPVEHCHRHCRHTSGTVTIATQDWSCHPGLVRRVTARESERYAGDKKSKRQRQRARGIKYPPQCSLQSCVETKGEREERVRGREKVRARERERERERIHRRLIQRAALDVRRSAA